MGNAGTNHIHKTYEYVHKYPKAEQLNKLPSSRKKISDGIDVGPYQATERTVQCEGVQKEGTSTSSSRGLLQFQNL